MQKKPVREKWKLGKVLKKLVKRQRKPNPLDHQLVREEVGTMTFKKLPKGRVP
jgi:hypothetical protein